MIELFRQAFTVQSFIEERGWKFCFIGGIALQHWGEPRTTRDVDLTLFTGFGEESAYIGSLLESYEPRIENALQFALEHRVLLLRTSAPARVELDVALAGLPFEADMIGRSSRVNFQPGIDLRICSEDLFVLKAFANRPQDRADIIGIARRCGRDVDWSAIIERLGPLVALKEEPEIMVAVRDLRGESER